MKKTELILLISIMLGFVLKSFEVPGGLALMIFSFCILSIMYFYFGFAFFNGIRMRNIFSAQSYAGLTTNKIVGAIAVGLSLSATIIGIMFKVMHWPGALVIIYIGMAPLIVIAIISAVKYSIYASDYYARILNRCVIVVAGAILLITIKATQNPEIESHENAPKRIYDSIPNYAGIFRVSRNQPLGFYGIYFET